MEGTIPTETSDSWFVYIATLDDGDDWTDPTVWIKANPSLNVTVKQDDLKRQIDEAREMPAQQNAIRRLRLNQWTEQVTRWLDMAVWDEGGPEPERESVGEWVDRMADRFEAAWRAGAPPALEDFLGDAPEPRRSALRAELVLMQSRLRTERERPTQPADTAGGPTSRGVPDDLPGGGRIGPYHLLARLGEGGMGAVYLAEQREPLFRRVALKMIQRGHVGP